MEIKKVRHIWIRNRYQIACRKTDESTKIKKHIYFILPDRQEM